MHVVNCDLPQVEYGGIDEYVHRIGRCARMGNDGFATSLYSERNEDIAPALVKLLLETNQTVPEFLQQYAPDQGQLEFSDDSDKEEDAGEAAAAEGTGWGSGAAGETNDEPAWGSGAATDGTAQWGNGDEAADTWN